MILQRLKTVDLSTVNLDMLINQCPEIPMIYLKVKYFFLFKRYHYRFFVDLPVRYAQKYLKYFIVNIYMAFFIKNVVGLDK